MEVRDGRELAVSRRVTERPYVMRISRLTVDKLGVKLYDKVSAVVAELIANSYDADAETVTVSLPLNTILAAKDKEGKVVDAGFTIEVVDNGHGMTPDEAIDFYLIVGGDRRLRAKDGTRSREKKRPVMGRKGIGKLAPFGICKKIEVVSAGGPLTSNGYLVTHFKMDFEKILMDTDEEVQLDPGSLDRTYTTQRGTTIRLSEFLSKRVPDNVTFDRQLAARFIFARPDFAITIADTRKPTENPPMEVKPLSVPTFPGTRIDLSTRPVITDDGEELSVSGWLGMARQAYKNEEMAGVRIYARGKIVGTTRDFEQPAGFTGEFTMRSYLVGEIRAEWLDRDEGEDLIRTDRQGILWDSDYGQALRKWGSELMREIGRASAKPRRERKTAIFLEEAQFEKRARERFTDDAVAEVAIDLAKQIGAFASEDELTDQEYVNGLSEVILSVAPHKALIAAFQEFNRATAGGDVSMDRLLDLFGKARLAEMASYSQIAAERVSSIRELEGIVFGENVDESEFQRLIARAPWLIEPTWSVISKNEALKTFKKAFEHFWGQTTGEEVTLAIDFETKRPDFTLVSVGYQLHIVEIKKGGHRFDDTDFLRMINYVQAFRAFFNRHSEIATAFPKGWCIDLVTDGINLRQFANQTAYETFVEKGEVRQTAWADFLQRAKTAHEMFLKVSAEAETLRASYSEE